MSNGFYTLRYDPRIKAFSIVPSKYLTSLSAEEQVDAIKYRIETLCDDWKLLEEMFAGYEVNKPEIIEKGRKLFLELEIAQQYLVLCRGRCRFPWTLEMANRFGSTA